MRILKKLVNPTVIYFLAVIILALLTFGARYGRDYLMLKNISLVSENGHLRTPYLALDKGNYRFVINYKLNESVPVTIQLETSNRIDGSVMEQEPECGYYVAEFSIEKSTSNFCFIFDDITDPEFEIYNIEIAADSVLIKDDAFFAFFVLLLGVVLYLMFVGVKKGKITTRSTAVILIISAVVAVSSYPMFINYLIYGHDLECHLMRIEGVKDAILDGQMIPVIYPNNNNGFGYLGFLYPSLFLGFSAVLRMIGASMVLSYQFMIVLINIATGIITYFSIKSMSDSDKAALWGTVVYVLSPYRMCDLYVRAALGESTAMIFIPLAMAGLYHILVGERKKWYYLAISLFSMLMSHMLTTLLTAVICIMLAVLFVKTLFSDLKRLLSMALGCLVPIVAGIWYLIPFVKLYSFGLQVKEIVNPNFAQYSVLLGELFMTRASTFVSRPLEESVNYEMQTPLGLAGGLCIIVILIGICSTIIRLNKENERTGLSKREIYVYALVGVAFVFVFMSTSLFPWKSLMRIGIVDKFVQTVQFPYRFISSGVALIAIASGVIFANTKELDYCRQCLFGTVAVLALIGSIAISDEYLNSNDGMVRDYTGGFTQYNLRDYLPLATRDDIFPDELATHSNGEIVDYVRNGTKSCVTYSSSEDGEITVPIIFYPGYVATDANGTKLSVGSNDAGRIIVYASASDNGRVNIHFSFAELLFRY